MAYDNTELFSITFLWRHPLTRPIIREYFGQINPLRAYSPSPAQRFTYEMLQHFLDDDSAAQLLYDLNSIPTSQLIANDIITELQSVGALKNGISHFIAERPYLLVLQSSDHRYLAESFLFYFVNRDNQHVAALNSDHVDHHIACRFFFTPTTWQDAMFYIRHQDGRLTNLDENTLATSHDAFLNYQVRYITRHFTDKSLIAAFNELFDLNYLNHNINKLYSLLDAHTREKDLEHKFLGQKLQKVEEINFTKFDDMFEYPVWFEFSDKVTDQIITRILDDKLHDYQIDYYLGVEEHHHDYAKLYPAIKHIITHTNSQHLLWTAGDVLNLIWQTLPQDERMQAQMRRDIYEMYWPKVGGIWPIAHYDEFEFKNKDKQKVFEDALGWVMCLKDINKLNPRLGTYLRQLARSEITLNQLPNPVMKRVFVLRHHRKSALGQHRAAFAELDISEAIRCTSYPEGIKEAEVTLDYILADSFDSTNFMFALEQLVLTGNLPKVGAYIINRYADELSRIETYIEQFNEQEIRDRDYIISIFTAACSGATELDELPALEKFATAIKALPIARTEKVKAHAIIERALTQAKRNITDYQREQKALAKLFA